MGAPMVFDVILLKEANNGHLARPLMWPNVVAQGATEQEALDRVKKLIRDTFSAARLAQVEVGAPEEKVVHPWVENAGLFADDATWEDFQQAIADYRRQVDENPEDP